MTTAFFRVRTAANEVLAKDILPIDNNIALPLYLIYRNFSAVRGPRSNVNKPFCCLNVVDVNSEFSRDLFRQVCRYGLNTGLYQRNVRVTHTDTVSKLALA